MSRLKMVFTVMFFIATVILAACAPSQAVNQGTEAPGIETPIDTDGNTIPPNDPTGLPAGEATEAPQVTVEAQISPTVEAGLPETGECAGILSADLISQGQTVYETSCAGCHGQQGEGAGDFPALAGNAEVTAADATEMISTFLDPQVHPFITSMEVGDVAAVISYVRNSFGNEAGVVCADQLEGLIPSGQ